MTWPLAALAVLGVALAAGFAWYERARPDARIIALVGTLAAFAALGRIAFAAVPNVKPTTDIVLVAGYALGGGPGFAVGALAGLTSNFFFGQGPWTPWQMAAWGVTGMIGAGLAVATGRRIGRATLAAVCGVCGFAFTVVQDGGDWVTYSDHSLTALGLYVGRGLAFDAVHAVGCVIFALAFGPALVRSLQRFARRLQVVWVDPGAPAEPGGAINAVRSAAPTLLAVLIATGLATGLRSGASARAAIPAGGPAAYLLSAQNADGGYGAARGQPSADLFSGWAALGLAATGHSPLATGPGGRSAIDYIRAHDPGRDIGGIERTILVLRAAGQSARSFDGRDLVAALLSRRGNDGSTAGQVNLTAFAILALRSAGVAPASRTVAWLRGRQNRDGGFGYVDGSPSDPDDTGAVLEALAGGPASAGTRTRAVTYLRGVQNRDGGFPAQPGQSSNAQSTAWAVQGLDAAGTPVGSVRRAGGPSPLGYLHSLVAPDGSVRYARELAQTPVWVTGEALMALAGRPLPLGAVPAPAVRRPPAPAATSARTGRTGNPGSGSRSSTRHADVHPAGGSGTSRPYSRRRVSAATPHGSLVAVALALLGASSGPGLAVLTWA